MNLHALAGSEVELRLNAVQLVLGIDDPHRALELQGLGVLQPGPSSGKRLYYLLDPGLSALQLYERWLGARLAAKPVDWRYDDFDAVARVRTILGVDRSHPLPTAVERLALADMLDMRSLHPAEANARLRPADGDLAPLMRRLRLMAGRPFKHGLAAAAAWLDLESFRLALPAPLARAPLTCFDPDGLGEAADGDGGDRLHPAPREEVLGRLVRLARFRDRACFAVMLSAGRARRRQTVEGETRLCERIDALLEDRDVDPDDAHALASALRGWLLHGEGPAVSEAVRAEAVLHYLSTACYTRTVVQSKESAGLRACRPYAWTVPHDAEALRKIAAKRDGALRKAGFERVHDRAVPVKDDIERLFVGIEHRIEPLHVAADAAEDAVLHLQRHGLPNVRFPVVGPMVNLDGSLGAAVQSICLRAWRESALLEDLLQGGARGSGTDWHNGRNRLRSIASGEREEGFYFEHLGTFGEDGVPGVEPFFVPVLATAVPSWPGTLPPWLRLERRELIREWALPGPIGTPKGLLTFGKAGMGLFRLAAWRNRILLPLAEFRHAMAYAHCAARQTGMTGVRIHEAMQTAARQSRTEVVDTPHGPMRAWKHMPKTSIRTEKGAMKEISTPLDARTWRHIGRLVDLNSRRCHAGAPPPVVPADRNFNWKCGPDAYVYEYDGIMIEPYALSQFLRLLTAGLMDVRYHDLRRGKANRLKHAGAPLEIIGRVLDHSPWIAGQYATDTPAQRIAALANGMADIDRLTALGVSKSIAQATAGRGGAA